MELCGVAQIKCNATRGLEGPLKITDKRRSLKRKENWRKLLLLGIQTGDKWAKPLFFVAYSQLCRHCGNLAEGGCLLSQFHFTLCRYFLGHVACWNLPWQGLKTVGFFLKISNIKKYVKRGVRVLHVRSAFLASLHSLALCFQPRSRPFVGLLARTRIRKNHIPTQSLFMCFWGERRLGVRLRHARSYPPRAST